MAAIVFGVTTFSAGVVTMMLPETRGKPLPDFVGKSSSEEEMVILGECAEEAPPDYTSTV